MMYINPYNFVPLENAVDRRTGHPGFLLLGENRYSGKFECSLTALSDLITLGKQVGTLPNASDGKLHEFCKNGDNLAIIRGTSIKGMIRAVYESLQNGCMWKTLITRRTGDPRKDYNYSMPRDFDNGACNDIQRLCPVCRIFGMVSAEKTCKGRLGFSDARLAQGGGLEKESRVLKVLDAPKPRHNRTYGKSGAMGDPISGRKFYYHHSPSAQWHQDNNRHAKVGVTEYAPRNIVFRFSVAFENLTREEVQSLMIAIELRAGLAHKIGLGKAIGLGSCVIRIIDAESIIFNKQRYEAINNPAPFAITTFRQTGFQFPPALVEVLRLNKHEDETDDLKIGYPRDFHNYPNGKINKRGVLGGPVNDAPGTAGHDECISGAHVSILATPMPRPVRQQPVALERDKEANGLISQVRVVNIGDSFAFERIVRAMENMDNEEEQQQVAKALKNKLIATGRWEQHKLRMDIEICLPDQ